MPANLVAGRTLIVVVAATYLLSAALLGWAKSRGSPVETWVVVGWLVTGSLGIVLGRSLRPGAAAAWAGVGLVLVPWMLLSFVLDVRARVWVMAGLDVAGVAAIGAGLWMARAALRG
jgi:hypothetical protein